MLQEGHVAGWEEQTLINQTILCHVCHVADAMLISTPFYGAITEHLGLYTDVKLYHIHLDSEVGVRVLRVHVPDQLTLISALIIGGAVWCFYFPLLGCVISRPVARMADFFTSP